MDQVGSTPHPRHRASGRTRRVRAALVLSLALAMLAGLVSMTSPAPAHAQDDPPPEDPGPVAITEGSLEWVVKASWARYTGGGEAAEGATKDPATNMLTFPLVEGTYDEATATTVLQFAGSVRYAAHCYPQPDLADGECALDLSLSDLKVTISPTEQVMTGHVLSRRRMPPKTIVDYGVIPVVNLDLLTEAGVETVEGVTTWDGILTALTPETSPAFDYGAGTAFDPLHITYVGPGGAPDLGEIWTPEGRPLMTETGRWRAAAWEGGEVVTIYPEEGKGVIHALVASPFAPQALIRAHDAVSLEPIATAVYSPALTATQGSAFDPETGRIFVTSAANVGGVPTLRIESLVYDPGTQTYEVEEVATQTAATVQPQILNLSWDPLNRRLVTHGQIRDPQNSQVRDPMITTWNEVDGSWVQNVYPIDTPEGFAPHEWVNIIGPSLSGGKGLAVAADGSIVMVRNSSLRNLQGQRYIRPRVLRAVIDDGQVTVAEIPGTGSDEIGSQPSLDRFSSVITGDDGTTWFTTFAVPGQKAQEAGVGEDGFGLVGPMVPLPPLGSFGGSAVDPEDGTLWLKAHGQMMLAAVRDGKLIFEQPYADFGRNSTVAVGAEHTVYSALRSEQPPPVVPGLARFAYEGTSPTITTSPQPATAVLGVGEGSEELAFSADGFGDPQPQIQWQRRPRGATRFHDIPDATGTDLALDVVSGDDGAEVRAVLSNLAGAVATDPVEVTVLTAPSVALAPVDATVEPGATAKFAVQGVGNPEPEVSWQRYSGGFWADVDPTAGDIVVDGGFLDVPDVVPDMDGARFRARISNEVATIYSNPAMLVVAGEEGPPGEAPELTSGPAGTSVVEGGDAEFAVTVTGTPAPALQWQRLVDGLWWEDVQGATGATFTMPDVSLVANGAKLRAKATNEHGVDISAPAVLTVWPVQAFDDVDLEHPFYEEITWLVRAGIAKGFADGGFHATALVTRQAVAAFLYRYAGEPEVPDDAPTFIDVPVGHPFHAPISWLASQGIAQGYGDGTFGPGLPVTRQAVAAFLYRAAGNPDGEAPECASQPFVDVPVGHPFCGEIAWMVEEGIAEGFEGGLFMPAEIVTRQAAAAFLHGLSLLEPPG